MFLRVGAVSLAVVLAGCTSTGDQSTGTTFNLAPICQQLAVDIVEEAQTFVDEFNDASLSDFPQGELPGLEDLRESIEGARNAALAQGCGEFGFEEMLALEARTISGRGPVGRPLAASLQGFDPSLVPPSTVELGPDDDLAGAIYELGTKSTVELAAGEYELDESIVVDRELTIVGAGPDQTRIRSSSPESALLVIGAGDLDISELSIEHTGDEPATVLVAAGTGLHVDSLVISGAVANEETQEDGNGLALVGPGAEAGVDITNSSFRANERIGVAVFGTTSVRINGGDATENGLCGVCVFDEASVAVDGTSIMNNVVGIGASATASLEVSDGEVADNDQVGVLVEAEAVAVVGSSRFIDNSVAIEVSGTGRVEVTMNTITGGEVGIVVIGEATTRITDNDITEIPIAIQAGEEAAPVIRANRFAATETAAMLFGDAATGIFSQNEIADFGEVGIQVSGTAWPLLADNQIEGPGSVAVAYIEASAGRLTGNEIRSLAVGLQIAGEAAPGIENNLFDDLEEYSMAVFEDALGTITGNECSPGLPGIVLIGGADPSLSDNNCAVVRG